MSVRSSAALRLIARALTLAVTACGLDSVIPFSADDSSSDGDASPAQLEDDIFFGQQDQRLVIQVEEGLLANDIAGNTGPLRAVAVTATTESGATVTIEVDGGFVYEPLAGAWGSDHFVYEASGEGAEGLVGSATVHIAPRVIPLEMIAEGIGGLAIDGAETEDRSGSSIAGVGDVDGDGTPDIAIAAGTPSAGTGFVLTELVADAGIDLRVGAANQHAIVGIPPSGFTSLRVRAAGDVDGDNRADILAWTRDGVGLVLAAELVATVDFSTTHEQRWSSWDSARCGDYQSTFFAVDGDGDVDGDGRDDLLLSLHGGGGSVALLLYGRPFAGGVCDPPHTTFLRPLEASGESVVVAGDIDGDGRDDLVLGLPGSGSYARVMFGQTPGGTNQSPGFQIHRSGDTTASSLAAAGHVNRDGLADLIVGVPDGIANGVAGGVAHVVYGKADENAIDLADIGEGGFAIYGAVGDELGRSVSAAGDVNGDGYGDVLVGAPNGGGDPGGSPSPMGEAPPKSPGRAYLIYGGQSPRTIMVASLGDTGIVIDSESGLNATGAAVSAAGDINGDGLDDMLIGAPLANPRGRVDAGRTYVVYGTRTAP